MLALIEKYLEDNHIQYTSIKGSTKNREEVIEKFNTDPNCMVFTASLLAGGLGIDLTGGSVVIHYDRWWNAAREDQATDRVYRIGQKCGVQVFKLVTEGTLEEKIDRLIFKKKNLMEDIITVDEASVMKKFSRDELVEILKWE
jgi:SNF2 family DNA or RNA helicase